MKTAMADTGPNIGQLAPEIGLLDGNGERWMLNGARHGGRAVLLTRAMRRWYIAKLPGEQRHNGPSGFIRRISYLRRSQ